MAIRRILLGIFSLFFCYAVVHCRLTCNFEDDTCDWHLAKGWMRSQGKASNLDTGPTDDRTNPDGFYLHLNLSNFQRDEKAFLLSPPILDMKKNYCLSFFYLMHGKQVATLSVHVVNTSSSTEVWATSFEHGPEWLHQEILIEDCHQLIFEGVFGGELGDIAIDDIAVREGECLTKGNELPPPPLVTLPFKCTFEGGSWCNYQNHHFNFENWVLGSGSTSTNGTGPDNDHTLRTQKGHYLHVDANSHFFSHTEVSLVSPTYKTSQDACIQFWYNMYGPGEYKLFVDTSHTQWSMEGSQGYGWKSAFFQVNGPSLFQLTFRVKTGRAKKGDIAIDDISIQEEKCPQSVDCSFEKTLCDWSNSGDDDFNWLPRTGKPSHQSLGPSTDHTLGSENGTYMIIESKAPRRQGDRARLVSTTLTENVKTHCLKFWYSMSGKNVGELRVFIYTQSSSFLEWRLIGPQGGLWAFAAVPIYPRRENFWIVIEGVVANPSQSYIAFDDISFISGNCKTTPSKAAIGGKTVTPNVPVKSTTPLITVNPGQIILSCDFTKDFCGWSQGKNDKANWIRTRLPTPSTATGPKSDHTTGKGSYIYVEASNRVVGPVRLFSRTITPTHVNMCLKFWYFMYGRDVANLRVYIFTGTRFNRNMNPHWRKSGSQQEKWLLGKIFFQMKQTFHIAFEATLNGRHAGDIALDDISLIYGPCNAGEEITTPKPGITEKPIPIKQRNCDFESKNICGYTHVKGSRNYYWHRNSGETDSRNTGPSVDHTTNSAKGYYMYIEGSHQQMGTVARMVTPLYQDSTSVCLQFYYHMYGSGIGNFSIYILSGGRMNDTQLIYFTSGDHGINWQMDRVTIDKMTAITGYKIMFEATVGKNYRADIALDDVSFSTGKCAFLGDCNFEDASCTWKNVQTDDFDWTLRSGKTPTAQTGPQFDHTFRNNKGHYMYIETSPPIKPGMKAQLVSALLPKIGNYMCLQFWYNMNGKAVDSLKVILQVTGYSKLVLWHLNGNQGKNWFFARVPLRGTATTYTLTFEATSGKKYTADIAIDDISFTENRCQILPVNAQVTTTAAPHITTRAPTTPAPVTGNFSCNFDKNYCGWKQDLHDTNQWHWKSGPTSTANTGPPGDHTSGKGSYIYLETSNQRQGSVANLISPVYKPDKTGFNCVSFWYYMYGAHVRSLRVYIQYGLTLPSSPTWSESGNKGRRWILGKFSFNSNRPFNVVLSAVVGLSYDGDIAVDDVSISNGDCVDYDTNAYITCDFEKRDLCGFRQGKSDTYDWTWHSGRTPSANTGPNYDHTFGTRAGHYVFIEGSHQNPRGYSRLISPVIHTTYTSCVEFYYHMRGHVGQLFVYLTASNYIKRLWSRSGHQSDAWQLAYFEVASNFTSYSLMFEAFIGGAAFGDIALDDFSVIKGKCNDEARCDFEKGICIWQNSKDDDFDWIIKKADKHSRSIIPKIDHTKGLVEAGHFLYVSTDHNPLHSKALIETTDFEPRSKTCLHFWFNGYGKDPGTFTVSLKSRGYSRAIWQLAGTKAGRWPKNGNWHEARVQIPRTSRTFTISIDVVVGSSGYVAIDDVIFDNEKDCSRLPAVSLPVITKPPTTIKTTLAHVTSPTTPKRVPSVSCHFTHDICGWTQDTTDDINWMRMNRSSPTHGTGPSADHTSGTGSYIYIESSFPTKAGDVARIISPKISLKNHQTKCLTFWYSMYGESVGALSLLLLVNGQRSAPIWKRQRFQGKNWMKGKVNLKGYQSLQVVFEANSGSGFYGDIALDDIELHEYSCHMVEASPLPSCDFEGTCNYKTVSKNGFIPWIISSSSNHPKIADHTYNTISGEFMFANITGISQNKVARMVTPVLKSGRYCLEFFYRTINNFNGFFRVFISSNGVSRNQFFRSGIIIKNQWTIAELWLKESANFAVNFETISFKTSHGTLAVDDIAFLKGGCPRAGSCDFERGHLCFWTNDPANKIDWTVNNGKTMTPHTGPLTDHTKETAAGMYGLLETSYPAKVGDRARLMSQTLNNNNVKSCFQFWYSMNGRQVASLSVSIKSAKNVETTYWRLSGNQGTYWHHGQVPLPASKEDFQIVIEGRVGGKFGDIAVDDLYVRENGCGFSPRKARVYISTTTPPFVITTTTAPIISGDNTFNCTFEKGTCGWVQSNTADFNWLRHQGYTPSKETGPQGDHTTGRGYYMYLEASGNSRLKKAELTFTAKSVIPGMKCMQFWYSMRGANVGSLNIYIITDVQEQSPVWTKSGTQGPTWNLGMVEFNATATFKVKIEGYKGHGFLGDIALDDVTLHDGGCKEPYGDCDFEEVNLCEYKNDHTADFRWKRNRGGTSTYGTGPTADHTYGTYRGHYMYIESSYPRKPNNTARLMSPVYKAIPDEHCLQFYYNMYGKDVGALNVKIRIHDLDNSTYDTDNYLHIVGNQGKEWMLAQVELPKMVVENPYQLIFEGVIGTGYRGDIALDDILISYGQCEIGGDCDFDYGRCTWVNAHGGDDFDWMVGSGATSTPQTGPVNDHTQQNANGFYLFIDASFPRIEGQKAWYVSQDFPPTYGQNHCITFWYSMNGVGVGILRVVIAFATGGNNTLWELNRDQGNDWLFGQAPIKSPTSYKIIFEAVRGPDHRGDIAIDDIIFTEFSCSVKPIIATPRRGKQTLPSVTGTTPSIHVTAGLNCTFDIGMCGWSQDTQDNFDWVENKGPTLVSGTGPSSDHNSNGTGFYLYIPKNNHHSSEKARLISPLMRPNGLQCFTVWYHMYGSDITSFNVYIFTGPKLSNPVFHRYGTKANKWFRADIQFSSRSPYNVILEAYTGWGPKSEIAVDDVSLVNGHCHSISVAKEKFCNFENPSICKFTNDNDYQLKWERNRHRGQVNLPDHTYNSRSGHFMFVRRLPFDKAGQYASLSTPVYSVNSKDLCVEFWYYMDGQNVGSLTVSYLTDSDNFQSGSKIFSTQGNEERRWIQALIDIDVSHTKHILLRFYGITGQAIYKVIALDDVKISNQACKRKKGDCNFEKDLCNWVNIHNDDFDWTIGSGFTTTTKSGPVKDHTRGTQDGSYLYIQPESTYVYEDNTNSRKYTALESETFDQSHQQCFHFYYYMKGAKDGGLEVLLHPEGSSTMTPIWQLEGHQSENWTLAQMYLPAVAKTYQIIIKGLRGPRFQGQIAIDDLSFPDKFPCHTLPKIAAINPTTQAPLTTTPAPIVGFDCTFNRGICGWHHDTHNKFKWSRQKGLHNGPSSDHTGGGFFLYLDLTNMIHGTKASLLSPNFPATTQKCLSFYYFMAGEGLNTLSVGFKNSDGLKMLWKRVGPQGNRWNHATVNLPAIPGSDNGTIQLTGIAPKVGASGFMAVDDITLYYGQCKPPEKSSKIDCDFESPQVCGYTQDNKTSFDWIRGSGENKLKREQPDSDHTYGTGHGHYMYFNSKSKWLGRNAVLWTPKFKAKKDSCLTFWYRMSGPNIGMLKVHFAKIKHVRYEGPVVWMRRGDQGTNWNQEYVNIGQDVDLYALFEGDAGNSPGGIAIDDVKLMPSCAEPGDCTFEIDSCGWHNARNNDLDWQRLNIRHITYYRRLPANDHTKSSTFGHYMFFTSRRYVNPGRKGDLLSVSFDPTSEKGLCFEFWFIIYGYNYGNLTIFKQGKSSGRTIMWQMSKTKGRFWTRASFHVKSFEPYQVIFRAVKGRGSDGYIAIDDINYSAILCTVSPVDAQVATPSTTFTTVRTTTAGPTVPPSPYGCTFESGFCNWTQATDDKFNWLIGTGNTDTDNTGPIKDHTLGTSAGHYIYIEASYPRLPNDTARLVSPVLPDVFEVCFMFWYHMYGEDVDTLNIYSSEDHSKKKLLWSRTGTLDKKWYQGSLFIFPKRHTRIIIEATRGQGYKGDIAIDDIKVVKGSCPQKPNACDFENGDFCSYKQVGSDNFDWSLGSGATSKYLPRKDHTDKSNYGKFMYVNGNHRVNSISQILGPVMHSTYGSCVRFWYNLNGSISLNVYSVAAGETKMLKTYQEKSEGKWLLGNAKIKSSSTWEVMFEAKINAKFPTSYLAVDDIKTSYSSCGITGDCDFEYDTCYWKNLRNDNFDWVLKKAGVGRTGPKTDHTLRNGKGSYLLIEGSSPQKPGDKAILRSPLISRYPMRRCLKFWYSMHGGQLAIGLERRTRLSWRVSGSHEESGVWKYAQMPVSFSSFYTSIVITGTIGSGSKSYIALDDITFHTSSCTRFPNISDPRYTTPVPKTPPTTQAPFVPHSNYDCSFETDFCSWNQSNKDNFNWLRAQGSTRTVWTGPDNDHTFGTASGWYAYIEASRPRKKGDTAILVSRPFKSNTDYCFMFYYYMFGSTLGKLSVILKSQQSSNLTLWTKSENHGQIWLKEAFKIPKQKNPFTIFFWGEIGSNVYGDIAIDDIRASEGECPYSGPLNCTFETIHLCGYTTPEDHGVKWKKHSFGKGGKFGPRRDHTLSSLDGTYMYLELSSADQTSSKAQLVSPVIKKSPDLCMSFYYKMQGLTEGYLSVYQQIGQTTDTPIWIHWKIHSTWWEKGQVTLPAHDNYKVLFEGKLGNAKSSILIDDISTVPGVCPEPGNCNFERGLCAWKNMIGNELYWKRANGRSPTENTGPTTDHTTHTDSGYYMFIEASFSQPYDSASLRSMSFPPTTARCMHFWYHMYGKQMGGLKIYFADEKTNNKTAIWYLNGNQGNKWQYAQVAFAFSDVYYLIIEGTVGTGYSSDIAIDDLTFTQDYCATVPITAQTDYVFPKQLTTTAPPTWSPSSFDCNFETGFCSWQQSHDDNFDWQLNFGPTISRRTGPTTDHTLKTKKGHYIYIETSYPQRPNDIARLESPNFVPTQTGCLQFWYFMYGPDVDTLTVYIKEKGKLTVVWTKTGTADPAWHQALVPIQSDNKIQIVFEGRKGRHWLGDIAIDDIAFSFKGCKISADMTCGFENSKICGFTQSRKDTFDWRWFSTNNYNVKRQSDHTFNTFKGHYMLVSGSNYKPGGNAVIISPTYTSKISKCIEFWYYMTRENSGTLNVYSAINGTRMKLWSRIGNQGNVWSLAQMTVRTKGAFHVEIEAVTDRNVVDISIDDIGLFEGECPKPGNCDFEKGWCTWNNNRTDDFDWQIGTGHLGMFGAPRQDHTTNSITGHFIFFQSDYRFKKGTRTVLFSEVLDGTLHKCMSFWYYMNGAGTGTLNIYTVTSESKNLSWTLTGGQPYIFWAYAQFPVHHNQEAFKILIEGIKGESSQINIAIDDIYFSDQNCRMLPRYATILPPTVTSPIIPSTTMRPTPVPTPFDCTFEKGMCRWKQDKTDNFDWIRSQGPLGSNVSGPIYDHTRGDNNGWYVFTDISNPREPFDKSRLIGPLIKATQDRCFNFWYHMHGSYISKLAVILSVNGMNETTWTKSGDQGDVWREASFNLVARPKTTYQVIFEGSRSVLTNGEIALDDVRFTKNKCHSDKPTYCDFEDGLCNYTQIQTDDFDWKRTAGKTPTMFTGPSTDHTTGTEYGHYMFIETSGKKEKQKAQFMSPPYNSNVTNCLHFYYFMYGEHVDELNVYRIDGTSTTEIGSPIWSRKYNQGKNWNEGQTSISPGDNYHIIFEGKVGKDWRGDIAIDDIYQTPGACQPPGFCDFEKDLCTWKNIKSDQFDWLRGKGYTDTPNTGPTTDHTLKTPEGYYAYIETSDPQAPGDIARLQSEDFLPSNMSVCLRFWCQMNGEHVDALNVLVRNINNKRESYVWSHKGNNGPEWFYAQLNVDRFYTNKPYHLIFEGVRGNGYNGDIAIDDIEISYGQCAIIPDYANPQTIALKKVECGFDKNICDWQQSAKDDLEWNIKSGPTNIYNTGPKAAHSGSGYIYTHNTKWKKGAKAILYSPMLGPTTGKGNCFTFYYHMYGMQIGTLNIYTVRSGEKRLRWTKSRNQGSNWKYAHFNIDSKYNYQIYIESISTGRYYEVIALDDFAMDGNPCPSARVCDFDLDLCGWTLQKYYKGWIHAMNGTSMNDHSTGTTTGGFLYTNASSEVKSVTAFRMVTPFYPPATKSCLKFWYYMEGSNPGGLHVYVKLPYTEKRIFKREGNQGKFWWQGHVEVGRPAISIIQPYKFVFESVQKPGSRSGGIVAIDDVEHLPGPCSNSDVCDFEQDLCGFNNINGDNFDWIRGSGKTDSYKTGPLADHTLKSPNGHYMFIEGSGIPQNQRALLSSWVHENTTGLCLQFWYNMYGTGMGKLNVYTWSPNNISKHLWSKEGNQGQDWLSASITIVSDKPFAVVFEGVRGATYASDIAIDDIKYLDGSCETQTTPSVGIVTQPPTPASMLRCGFERNLCGWKQDTTDNADWILTSGSSEGPQVDHTKDNKMGGFIKLNSSKLNINRTARLMSGVIYQDQPICLTFWYHMHGGNPGTLNVYVKNTGEKKDAVWTKYGDQGLIWRYAEIEIAKPEKENKVYFEAIRGSGHGDISLDDVDLLLDNCPPRDFCDFEEPDICGYAQGDTDVFDWTWGTGRTPTYGTGPKNDHTYGSKYGHYMYIETSDKSMSDHAHLYSPVYPATTKERCLTFWYNMNGRHVERLNVYLYQNNQFGDKIWTLQLNQGPHWHLATVSVNSEIPYQIVFEGVRGMGVSGDIAIDDVKLSKEACDPLAFCTFEEGICGWENLHDIYKADFDWQRTKASTSLKVKGPSVDHTIGDQSGYYMFVNAIHWKKGDTARLKSQTVPLLANNPKNYCFHFWYVVYGTDIGQLKVDITFHGEDPQTIWTQKGLTDSKWRHGMVSINNVYSHFEVVLEAVVGTGSQGYLAVDDLQLKPGICPNTIESKFTCRSGAKISSTKVCDFIHDCPDSGDEANCGSCVFEDDMCTWEDKSTGIFNWTRIQGNSNKANKIKTDHTSSTGIGWFVYMGKSGRRFGTTAVLQNRALQQTSSTCQLKFWFYLTTSYYTSLSLGILEGGRTTPFWKKSNYHGKGWNLAIADIGKISRPFKFQFIAKSYYSSGADIAIDDIELQNCNFPDPKESCSSTEFQCKRKGCVDKSRVCDLSDDCGDRSDETDCQKYTSCDFENGLCEWSQGTNDDFDWTRLSGATATIESGPSRDHSKGTGSGYYVYSEASPPRKKGDKARLVSPVIKPTTDEECWIRFFYHMNGLNMGTLNVYTRTSILGSYTKVWTKYGNLGDIWEKADAKLSSDHMFQVVFEAKINKFSSDMALDDITLTPGCHLADPKTLLPNGTISISTPMPCSAGLFHCKSSECILQSQVCDFINHCKDGSDEDICGTCNFELVGNCGWNDRSTDRFKWQSHQGDSPGKFGPIKDHTSNSDIGKYMIVLGNVGVFRSHAILLTRPFSATASTCQVEFYVYMTGDGVGEISLNIINPVTREVKKQVVKVIGNQGDKWMRIVGNIGAQPAGFALMFDALPNVQHLTLGSNTDMAIDDVKLFNCKPKLPVTTKQPTKTTTKQNLSTKKEHNLSTSLSKSVTTKTTTKKVPPAVTSKSPLRKTTTSVPSLTSKVIASTSSVRIKTSTPKGPKVCGNDSFLCPTAPHSCFPSAFLCDGYADCPDKYDEEHCSTCPKGQTYCVPKQKCISSHRCDDNIECPDGSDESACKECFYGFCANGGTCTMENGSPKCLCKDANVNFRCLVVKSSAEKSKNKKVWAIPVGIIMALVITAIVFSGIYFFWIRKTKTFSPERVDGGITNPAYDYGTNLPTEFNMLDLEPAFNEPVMSPSSPTSIENPLYEETTDNH